LELYIKVVEKILKL